MFFFFEGLHVNIEHNGVPFTLRMLLKPGYKDGFKNICLNLVVSSCKNAAVEKSAIKSKRSEDPTAP